MGERFFALPILFLAVPTAVFMALLQNNLSKIILVLLMGVSLALHNLNQRPAAERKSATFYENHIRNILEIVSDQ
jgi:hypothetical protein